MQENHAQGPDDRRLWEIPAALDALHILAVAAVVLVAYWLRAIVGPIAVAFALAWLFNPLLAYLKERWRVPRGLSVTLLILAWLGLLGGAGVIAVPALESQISQLIERAPTYVESLERMTGAKVETLQRRLASLPAQVGSNPVDVLRWGFSGAGALSGFLGDAANFWMYALFAALIVLLMFIVFATRFDRLGELQVLVPRKSRAKTLDLFTKMDRAVRGFVRGQLIVAVFTTIGFCVGFYLADVPHWFVVSLIGGTLSVIPYGQSSGLILAWLLKFMEAQVEDANPWTSWFSIFVAPSMVYAVTQTLESWVITPLVQSETTRLHPMTIMLALVIGGYAAGFIGLILSIPVAAVTKILLTDIVLPRWRSGSEAH